MMAMVAPELFRPALDIPEVSYDTLLRQSAERTPERVAIRYYDLRLTYREVVSMVNSCANGLRSLGIPIVQGYGLTESSPDTHFSPASPELMRIESAGLLVHNTQQKIMDIETGTRELPQGEDGEIVVSGPQVMLGYWKAPEETARVLRDGWLYTGDIGHLDADGFLYIVDCKKEMIKYKAFSIAPAELEGPLLEHAAVQDAAVIGIPDDEAGKVPKGFVVVRHDHQVTSEELIAFVNSRVAGYKKLYAIEFIDAIPKVPSGKILRRELKELERTRAL